MAILPCCYFPTTVLFVDDNSDFLSALTLLIGNYTPVKIESNPRNVLSMIEKDYLRSNILQACFQSIELEEFRYTTRLPMTVLNLNHLHRLKK